MTDSHPLCELCGEPMPKGEEMFKIHGYSGACLRPPLQQPWPTQGPQSHLGKLLEAIVRSVGGADPRAFAEVDISEAIAEADALSNASKPHPHAGP